MFGDVQLRLISRESIQTFLADKLKEGLSRRTVKHLRTTLGTILGTAEFWGYIEDNPVRKTRLPRRGLQWEKPVLAPEQLSFLLEAPPEPSKSLVWLLVLTGLRIGELRLYAGEISICKTACYGDSNALRSHFNEPKT